MKTPQEALELITKALETVVATKPVHMQLQQAIELIHKAITNIEVVPE